jgi:hypothetical protein
MGLRSLRAYPTLWQYVAVHPESRETMRFVAALVCVTTLIWFGIAPGQAETRLALLIGNQAYGPQVGPLKNPHNDIELVGGALRKLGFRTKIVKDANIVDMGIAINEYINEVNQAGRDTVSFIYYSGHGAADSKGKNYLIPVDIESASDPKIWTQSIELQNLIDRLRTQAHNAVHYVVFDACRDELRLPYSGTKTLGNQKGFLPIGNVSGALVAYATAPGKTATDIGVQGGPYAKALSAEIVRPGVEAVTMFRNVQLKVKEAIGQDPWLSLASLREVYLAGKGSEVDRDWAEVKDTQNVQALEQFIQRHKNRTYVNLARKRLEQLKQEQDHPSHSRWRSWWPWVPTAAAPQQK